MIYTLSKKLFALSFLAFTLIATTFTLARNNDKKNDDNDLKKNYLNGTYSQDDDDDNDDDDDDNRWIKDYKYTNYQSGNFLS
jgi:hypothetical protein